MNHDKGLWGMNETPCANMPVWLRPNGPFASHHGDTIDELRGCMRSWPSGLSVHGAPNGGHQCLGHEEKRVRK